MRAILYIGILFSTVSCTRHDFRLQPGDLLFAAGETGDMTGAITAATGKNNSLNFSHVGIAVPAEDADSVLEATTDGGVRMTALAEFLTKAAPVGEGRAVEVKRLRDTTGVAQAVARAKQSLGLPYDYSFLPANGKLYCSELIWENYLAPDGTPLFPARPMNFRAADGMLPAFWQQLFDSLGEPVPEGIPGTNPNDMAREPILENVGRFF